LFNPLKKEEEMKHAWKLCGPLLAAAAFFASCGSSDEAIPSPEPVGTGGNGNIPEGYFEAVFGSDTRAVSGVDGRVKHLLCVVYDRGTGAFVDEKEVLKIGDPAPSWPLEPVRFVLPNGSYTAVFLGNVHAGLFEGQSSELLKNYKDGRDEAEIMAPDAAFTEENMYYWASIDFSTEDPVHNVLLQRIVSMQDLYRNVADTDELLNTLVTNIIANLKEGGVLETTIRNLLSDELKNTLGPAKVVTDLLGYLGGGLDELLVDPLLQVLVAPVLDKVCDLLVDPLLSQASRLLAANEGEDTALSVARLNVLLNPWAFSDGSVSLNLANRYTSVGLDLKPRNSLPGLQTRSVPLRFNETAHDRKFVRLITLGVPVDCTHIDVDRQGLLGGAVVDDILEELILRGSLVDITDELKYTPQPNRYYRADYSLVELNLKDYNVKEDGNPNLSLTVKLADVANIDELLNSILDPLENKVPLVGPLVLKPLLESVKSLVRSIEISVPVNLPVLSIENLTVTGSWSEITPGSPND